MPKSPSAFSNRRHSRGADGRDRKIIKNLKKEQKEARRAAAIQRDAAAVSALREIDHRLRAPSDLDVVKCAQSVMDRALRGRAHADQDMIDRVADAVDRIDLRTTANCFALRPDDLAEIRSRTSAEIRRRNLIERKMLLPRPRMPIWKAKSFTAGPSN